MEVPEIEWNAKLMVVTVWLCLVGIYLKIYFLCEGFYLGFQLNSEVLKYRVDLYSIFMFCHFRNLCMWHLFTNDVECDCLQII